MENSTTAQVTGIFSNIKAKTTEAETKLLLSLRNDKTNADEAVIIAKAVLYILTAFVIYLGFEYYQGTLSEWMPGPAAFAFAVLIPIVVELAKIRLAQRMLRSWWFGWINEGIYATAFWVAVSIMVIGAYWWSYTISTGGIKEVAKATAELKHTPPPLESVIAAATADVDARMQQIDAADNSASSMKTKKGRIAWSGQSIMMNNAEARKALMAERAKIVESTTADYEKGKITTEGNVNKWSIFIQRFGGWGEFGTAVCLFIISFFEKRLAEANKKALTERSDENLRRAFTTDQNNTARPAAYNKGQYGAQLRWHGYGSNAVPQPQHPVPQQNASVFTSSEEALRYYRSELQKEPSNFHRKDANRDTVAGRMHDKLNRAHTYINQVESLPEKEAIKFRAYLVDDIFPILEENGFPYEGYADIIQSIDKKVENGTHA